MGPLRHKLVKYSSTLPLLISNGFAKLPPFWSFLSLFHYSVNLRLNSYNLMPRLEKNLKSSTIDLRDCIIPIFLRKPLPK